MKLLYAWTGYRELLEAKNEYPEYSELFEIRIKTLTWTPQKTGTGKAKGWIRTALKETDYDRLILLDDYNDRKALDDCEKFRAVYKQSFSKYNIEIDIIPVIISDINDYAAVYQATKAVLGKTAIPEAELFFLLLSGSYAMNICWILLGKTLFEGAHFLRNQGDEIKAFDIPLNLTVEYIPKRLSRQDNAIQHFYDGFEGITGNSALIKKAQDDAHKAALHDVTVLLVGESGTGKEKFAEAIQKASPRKDRPYKIINCAAIPAPLLEDTLFGHKKGAYTGADKEVPGILKEADGGTLFLDEVGECPPEMQAKLLRVLQPPSGEKLTYREYYPVGSRTPEHSDVRIIAATNRDLRAMSLEKTGEQGSFRSDLLFRLSAITINLPPLRKRQEDILPLADALLKKTNELFAGSPGFTEKKFSSKTRIIIQNYDWPGNVRELSNAILRGATMVEGKFILPNDLGIPSNDLMETKNAFIEEIPIHGIDINAHLEQELRKWIEIAIKRNTNKKAAAEWLGLKSPQALDSKMKTIGVKYPQTRK